MQAELLGTYSYEVSLHPTLVSFLTSGDNKDETEHK